MVLYILTFTFLHSRREDRRLWTERQQVFPEFGLLLISSLCRFITGHITAVFWLSCALFQCHSQFCEGAPDSFWTEMRSRAAELLNST
jgi:hypothetical protein